MMLILTRRVGETIMIGDNVAITVLGIQGGQTRIGIDAPPEIKVHREEIYLRIQQEQNGLGQTDQEQTGQEQNGQEPFHYQKPVPRPSNQPLQQRIHTPVISVRPRSRFSSMPVAG